MPLYAYETPAGLVYTHRKAVALTCASRLSKAHEASLTVHTVEIPKAPPRKAMADLLNARRMKPLATFRQGRKVYG